MHCRQTAAGPSPTTSQVLRRRARPPPTASAGGHGRGLRRRRRAQTRPPEVRPRRDHSKGWSRPAAPRRSRDSPWLHQQTGGGLRRARPEPRSVARRKFLDRGTLSRHAIHEDRPRPHLDDPEGVGADKGVASCPFPALDTFEQERIAAVGREARINRERSYSVRSELLNDRHHVDSRGRVSKTPVCPAETSCDPLGFLRSRYCDAIGWRGLLVRFVLVLSPGGTVLVLVIECPIIRVQDCLFDYEHSSTSSEFIGALPRVQSRIREENHVAPRHHDCRTRSITSTRR